jgi:hypothetical protein
MRQAIMRDQEQRRLQYLQQMQEQQRRPGGNGPSAGREGRPEEGAPDQPGQAQTNESGRQSDELTNFQAGLPPAEPTNIKNVAPETDLKTSNIKAASLQATPSHFKTADLQAQPANSPGETPVSSRPSSLLIFFLSPFFDFIETDSWSRNTLVVLFFFSFISLVHRDLLLPHGVTRYGGV